MAQGACYQALSMHSAALTTPVAFVIFNRLDTAERVFAAIRAARPPKLLVIADGPRASRPGEAERCRATRALIERVDWPCEVLTNFSEQNLGCKRRLSSGLDWVFSQVEEAIVLEDDCVPAPSFFFFCQELLARYRDDPRVMAIGGSHFLGDYFRAAKQSYFFSNYVQVWGWATWRRAWAHYDVGLRDWPAFRSSPQFKAVCPDRRARRYFRGCLDRTHAGAIDTWDYQLLFALWRQRGLTILPTQNLVTNIGVTPGATHQVIEDELVHNLPVQDLWQLTHPAQVAVDRAADRALFRRVYGGTLRRAAGYLRRGLKQDGLGGLTRATVQLARMTVRSVMAR